jgi:hypothetical protein
MWTILILSICTGINLLLFIAEKKRWQNAMALGFCLGLLTLAVVIKLAR